MKQLLLIYGGRSGEHKVSLRSAAFVYSSIDKSSYNIIPLAITQEGHWYIQDISSDTTEEMPVVENESKRLLIDPGHGFLDINGNKIKIDIVFPVVHGTFGEDGTLQGLLEMIRIPYVGARVMSSSVAMDKETTKTIWRQSNLSVVPDIILRKSDSYSKQNIWEKTKLELGLPVFIKPANAGSSVGVSKATTYDEFSDAIDFAFKFDSKLLIEKAISAREVECSVIGNHDITVFPPGEINPNHDYYDYDAKYIDPDGAGLLIPANLSEKDKSIVMDMAKQAYSKLDLTGLSRVDIFMDKNDNKFYINEVNTMPGFTSISMFPQLCMAAGLQAKELMQKLIDLALELFEERDSLQFCFDPELEKV